MIKAFKKFWIFSIAAGLAIGNLYVAQPLLVTIGSSLGVSTPNLGVLAMVIQLGYALGTILLLPLGDLLPRKNLVPVLMVCAGSGLLVAGLTSSYLLLAITLGAIGLTTISGQMLVALTGDLSEPASRGKNLGVVVSGIMGGILIARTVSGLAAGVLGWQGSFLAFGALNVCAGLALSWIIPVMEPKPRVKYFKLVADVFLIPAKNPSLILNLVLNAIGFALFSALWTSITFLLSGNPFNFGESLIGLFGLVGVVGALMAQPAGKLFDKGKGDFVLILAFAGYVVSFLIGTQVYVSLAFLVMQLLVLDAAGQINNVVNQTRILTKFSNARSRVNASYVASNFIGGAIGTVAAATLWPLGGWVLIQQISACLSLGLCVSWVILGKTQLISRTPPRF